MLSANAGENRSQPSPKIDHSRTGRRPRPPGRVLQGLEPAHHLQPASQGAQARSSQVPSVGGFLWGFGLLDLGDPLRKEPETFVEASMMDFL